MDIDDDTTPDNLDDPIPYIAEPVLESATPIEIDATPSQRSADVAHATAIAACAVMGGAS